MGVLHAQFRPDWRRRGRAAGQAGRRRNSASSVAAMLWRAAAERGGGGSWAAQIRERAQQAGPQERKTAEAQNHRNILPHARRAARSHSCAKAGRLDRTQGTGQPHAPAACPQPQPKCHTQMLRCRCSLWHPTRGPPVRPQPPDLHSRHMHGGAPPRPLRAVCRRPVCALYAALFPHRSHSHRLSGYTSDRPTLAPASAS